MSSSDACFVRKGQLEQMIKSDEKKKHFIQAKTLEKNSCKPEWKQKSQEKVFSFIGKLKVKHPLLR